LFKAAIFLLLAAIRLRPIEEKTLGFAVPAEFSGLKSGCQAGGGSLLVWVS
jgi:hypothetical protein